MKIQGIALDIKYSIRNITHNSFSLFRPAKQRGGLVGNIRILFNIFFRRFYYFDSAVRLTAILPLRLRYHL